MRQISDDDLTLLFYGEHDDPDLAARVAGSAKLSARFEALCAELQPVDTYLPPERGEDFGAEVWLRISPRLTKGREESARRLTNWGKLRLSSFGQPRFSIAGLASFALVAALAFILGRNGGQENNTVPTDLVANPATVLASIDSGRLLTRSVSGHLDQVDLVLTQFANMLEPTGDDSGRAADMLFTNRLYRLAATAQGKHRLAAFLAELEPLLIELAYQAQTASPATRERMQQEVRDGLLFRVRVMNKQLNKSGIST